MFRSVLFAATIILLSSQLVLAQEEVLATNEACDNLTIFTIVEQMPKYRGGIEQLESELNQQLSFEKKVKGDFHFRCTINCIGELVGIKESSGDQSELAEKIKNQLSKLKDWEVGKQREFSVNCYYHTRVKVKKGKLIIVY